MLAHYAECPPEVIVAEQLTPVRFLAELLDTPERCSLLTKTKKQRDQLVCQLTTVYC
jgi:hypothetical protein